MEDHISVFLSAFLEFSLYILAGCYGGGERYVYNAVLINES